MTPMTPIMSLKFKMPDLLLEKDDLEDKDDTST
jgi:hypothetical protein